jgi:hypothetical protein
MPLDDETPEIIERLELQYDFNELRRRMRRVLAITERLSVLPDALMTRQTTPAEIRATIGEAEKAVHLLDDQLRLVIPHVLAALRLDVGQGVDAALPW